MIFHVIRVFGCLCETRERRQRGTCRIDVIVSLAPVSALAKTVRALIVREDLDKLLHLLVCQFDIALFVRQ